MDKMTFRVDRTRITEGDVVEVKWNCPMAESVELTIDNGFKASALPLEGAGTKRFRLNRSKGRTRLTLTARVEGKSYSKTLKVKVDSIPVTRAETVDSNGRRLSPVRQWLTSLLPKWQTARMRHRQTLAAMPPDRRLATRLLALLGGVLLVSSFFPRLLLLGILGLTIYLSWFLLRGTRR